MTRRTLYLARHGQADPWGVLTDHGTAQSRLLGERLGGHPIDVVWHSPLPRAADSAALVAEALPTVLLDEAEELTDIVPSVPEPGDLSPIWSAFFDGFDPTEAGAGRRSAERLTARFATAHSAGARETHEVLITHAYPVAWLVRDALRAPNNSWLSLAGVDNAALTVITYEVGEPPVLRCVNDRTHLAGLPDPADGDPR